MCWDKETPKIDKEKRILIMQSHKCEYCDKTIPPCTQPCNEIHKDKSHVCCTCPNDGCELPVRIVCDSSLCNLEYTVDWYKIKLEESNNDIAKLKSLNNQFRIANIGSQAAQRLIDDGTLEISGIKLFVTKQRLTWENIPIETGYILMCLHEEFAKQWAGFLNDKAVKVQIKKDLIKSTEAKLNKAQQIREGKINPDGSAISNFNPPRKKHTENKVVLTQFEKLVLHNMKVMGLSQPDSESLVKSMGMLGESRDLKSLGII